MQLANQGLKRGLVIVVAKKLCDSPTQQAVANTLVFVAFDWVKGQVNSTKWHISNL